MNKIIISIVTFLAVTVAGASLAQEDVADPEKKKQRHHRQQPQRGMQTMPAVEAMMRAIRHLDLEVEQKESIKAIMGALKADIRPVMMATKENHEQLKELVKAGDFDEGVAATLADKEGDLAAERLMLTSRALSAVYNILTVDQRNELETMAAHRKDRRGGKDKPKSGEG